jgi:flavin-dependent dehydrogenase
MYDIAIIGLGPAGATIARVLDKKYSVIAIDRKNPGKCCGGLLSPDAQKILALFDICLPKDILADPQIFSVRTMDWDNKLERFYQRSYINMDRAKFDNFLVSLIPGHVEICRDAVCTKIEREDDHFNLAVKTIDGTKELKTRIVIGADGAHSIVRNTFYTNRKILKYTAIQEWYENKTNSPFYSCIFDKSLTDSYCWTISKNNHLIIGGKKKKKNSDGKFELLKEKLSGSGILFEKPIKREGCFVFLNKGLSGTCTGKDGAYLTGEAAGMISPSSLEGISYAMNSAAILSKIINSGTNRVGLKYFTASFGIRIKLLLKLLKRPFMYNKFLRALIMKSRINAIRKRG